MKTLSSTLATVLALAAPLAIAQSAHNTQPQRTLQSNEHALNLPGATTIEAPPAGFNPLTASDDELAYYGFPPRPDQSAQPKAYATWAKAMIHATNRITPTLEQTNIFHGPAKLTPKPDDEALRSNPGLAPQPETTYYSSNWSGYVDLSGATSYGSSSFYYTVNDQFVPAVHQSGCSGGWAYSGEWAGIDGFSNSDVLQAGLEADAYCSGSTTAQYYSTWYEWYPNGEVRISNFPVVPGQELFVEVWHTSSTQGYAYIENLSTSSYVEVGFTAPSGTTLLGNSAEWITEKPTAVLSDYVEEVYWDAYAYTEGSSFYDIATGSPIDISGLSYAQAVGPEAFFTYYY
jgi:hypothetical protein